MCASVSFINRFKGSWVGAGSTAHSRSLGGVAKATCNSVLLAYSALRGQNWASDNLDLELLTVVSCPVDAGNKVL